MISYIDAKFAYIGLTSYDEDKLEAEAADQANIDKELAEVEAAKKKAEEEQAKALAEQEQQKLSEEVKESAEDKQIEE